MLRVIERVTQQRIEEMTLPSVADVNQLRLVKFKEKVTAAVLSGEGKEFQPLLEQIESEANIPAIEIAAALASMFQGDTPLLLKQKEDAPAAQASSVASDAPTSTYRINVGHAHGVLPGNIVGAIANEANIEGKRIGHIDIREDHSFVDLPTLPEEMLGHLQKTRIRGEEIRITRVDSKPDKPKFSGQSRRPDRMAEERGERKPYMGGGNRFEREGGKRPYRSGGASEGGRPSYQGTPRYSRDDRSAGKDQGRLPPEFREPPRESGEGAAERPARATGDKPRAFKKDGGFFKKEGTGFKKDFKGGFKKAGPSFGKDRPAFKKEGFKKTFTGKAAGAKGSYKGGKAFRDKNK
jgi:hypothetical protein